MKLKSAALFGVVMFATSSAQATVKIDSAVAFARAAAVIAGANFNPNEKQKQAALQSGKHIVNAAVSVTNLDPKGNRGYDSEDVYANIIGESGTIDFSGNSASLSNSKNKTVESYNSGSSFNLDFTLTSSYTFNVNYAFSETHTGGFDNYFQLINTNGGRPIFSASPLNGSYTDPAFGMLSVVLMPGSYEFGATSHLGDLSGVQGLGYSSGSHVEQYSFNIAAVPEPASWAMMLIGFGMIGFAARRRQSVKAIVSYV